MARSAATGRSDSELHRDVQPRSRRLVHVEVEAAVWGKLGAEGFTFPAGQEEMEGEPAGVVSRVEHAYPLVETGPGGPLGEEPGGGGAVQRGPAMSPTPVGGGGGGKEQERQEQRHCEEERERELRTLHRHVSCSLAMGTAAPWRLPLVHILGRVVGFCQRPAALRSLSPGPAAPSQGRSNAAASSRTVSAMPARGSPR